MNLEDALRAELPETRYRNLQEIIEDLPSIRELAELWSGSQDHSSREYLNARRRFERYFAGAGHAKRGGLQTRAPRDLEAFLEQFRSRVNVGRERLKAKGAGVVITGTVQISNDRRHRTIRGSLSSDAMERLTRLRDRGRPMAQAFERAFGVENMRGQVPSWTDDDVELDLS